MSDIIKYIFDALFEIALIVCMVGSVLSGVRGNNYSINFIVFFGFMYLGAVIRHNKENADD